jgi:hypothetical protein
MEMTVMVTLQLTAVNGAVCPGTTDHRAEAAERATATPDHRSKESLSDRELQVERRWR